MALKVQFNKSELSNIRKQLKIREDALPTLKSKESALRLEVYKSKQRLKAILLDEKNYLSKIDDILPLFSEMPNILSIKKINTEDKKIAGVSIPIFDSIDFNQKYFSLFSNHYWFLSGIKILKALLTIHTKKNIEQKKYDILFYARKKTTQKVNLYEKVQIPDFEDAIMRIKRYLEDVDNLDRSSQKIIKQRLQEMSA